MSSVNKALLFGYLGGAVELRRTQNGKAVANFSLATSESYGQGEGRQERTEWHKVVCWQGTAEYMAENAGKGDRALVEGRIQSRKWTDKEGHERTAVEIVAEKVILIPKQDRREGSEPKQQAHGQQSQQRQATQQAQQQAQGGGAPFTDDDIPF